MEFYLNPTQIARKNNHKRGFFQESCGFSLQWAVPQTVEGLILLLILWEGILLHFHKKRVDKPVTKTRGALPPAM